MPNFILCYGETSGIFTSKGEEILVDTEDLPVLIPYNWVVFNTGYAMAKGKQTNYERDTIAMHRLLMSPPKPMVVDHINQQRSDNRKNNLRVVTRSENHLNCGLYKSNTSGFRGVSWLKKRNCWRATIKKEGKQHCVGYFQKASDAAIAWNKVAKELYGEVAFQNTTH